MNKLLSCAIVAVTCACLASAQEVRPRRGRPINKNAPPSGGQVEVVNTGKVVQVVNLQKIFDDDHFQSTVVELRKKFFYPFSTNSLATSGKVDPNAVARVTVVAKDDAPALLCAPEECWAEVNVKALAADNPNDYTLRTRVVKEMWRALGFALGCGNSAVLPCIMDDARTLKEIDALPKLFGPESGSKINCTAQNRGAQLRRITTYRRACHEGWAPAPTNDVQRKIWDELHTPPTKPLVILPESQRK